MNVTDRLVPEPQPRRAAVERDTTPGAWSYVVAVLVPFVGVILAVVAWARGHVGPGFALMATSMIAWTVAFAFIYGA